MNRPLISICILAGHDDEMLANCLRSLGAQADPPTFELIVGVADGGPQAEIVRQAFPDARLCVKGRGYPGFARNALIRAARGELLLFLDDDVTVAADLLRRLASVADAHAEASVFGGPNATPPGSSRFQVVQGAVLSSLVGAGPVSRRYGARQPGAADERWFTLCNLAVRRAVMVPFLADLVCAEENALLAQLRAEGELMRYEPSLRVFHARRPTWGTFARQMFKYGRGRGQLLMRHPTTVRPAYLAPSVLVVYLLLAAALLGAGSAGPLVLAPAAAYLAASIAGAAWIAVTLGRVLDAPLALALTVTMHACYGLGVLRGLAPPKRPRRRITAPRWSPPLEDHAPGDPVA